MRIHRKVFQVAAIVAVLSSLVVSAMPAAAVPIGDDAFWRTWARTDKPVADGNVVRTWMWGPEAYTGVLKEPYGDSPDGMRDVQYFDKSRMEIIDPFGDPEEIWYVTNGRLTFEMILGKQEIAYNVWDDTYDPANVGVAGDSNDTQGPTYATFTSLVKAPKLADGSFITQQIDRAGNVTTDESLFLYGVTAVDVDLAIGSWVEFSAHTVADVFWDFMNSEGLVYDDGQLVTDQFFINPYYGTGLPITEPYWTTVQVGGTPKEVLVQCFERRCMTYTPSNDPTWRVEAGNVGQHYYKWRYEQPSNQVPADQNVIHAWDITSWGSYADEHTTITPIGDALHYRTDTDIAIFGWQEVTTGDYSVRADVRLVDGGGSDPESTFACVVARLAADYNSNYTLCIYADGWIAAGYEYFDDEGVYYYDELVAGGYSDLVGPVGDWNTLKIVALGNQLWFVVNGELFGTANHAGPLTGLPGIYAISLDGSTVEWAFTDINVYSVE